jgi:hypothetical protein
MSLQTKDLNYALSGGAAKTTAIQVDGENVILQLTCADIPNTSTTLSLEQSVDGVNYATIEDSEISLDSAQTVQSWNVRGLVRGAFVRISIDTASASGTLISVKLLTSTL